MTSPDNVVRIVVAIISAAVSVISLVILGRNRLRIYRNMDDAQEKRLRQQALDAAQRIDAREIDAWNELSAKLADAEQRSRDELQRQIDDCARDAERHLNSEATKAARAATDALQKDVDERAAEVGGSSPPKVEILSQTIIVKPPRVVSTAHQLRVVEPSALAPALREEPKAQATQRKLANAGAGAIAIGALATIVAVPTLPVTLLALGASAASLLIAKFANEKGRGETM